MSSRRKLQFCCILFGQGKVSCSWHKINKRDREKELWNIYTYIWVRRYNTNCVFMFQKLLSLWFGSLVLHGDFYSFWAINMQQQLLQLQQLLPLHMHLVFRKPYNMHMHLCLHLHLHMLCCTTKRCLLLPWRCLNAWQTCIKLYHLLMRYGCGHCGRGCYV